jgi:hypothetical protein
MWLNCDVKIWLLYATVFPENLVTFHSLLHPTIAVGHDGSLAGAQTMECHKKNFGTCKIQATIVPNKQRRDAFIRTHDHHIQKIEIYWNPNPHLDSLFWISRALYCKITFNKGCMFLTLWMARLEPSTKAGEQPPPPIERAYSSGWELVQLIE